jgi:hypothetical protein
MSEHHFEITEWNNRMEQLAGTTWLDNKMVQHVGTTWRNNMVEQDGEQLAPGTTWLTTRWKTRWNIMMELNGRLLCGTTMVELRVGELNGGTAVHTGRK